MAVVAEHVRSGAMRKHKGANTKHLREKDELTGRRESRSQSVVSVIEEDVPREIKRWNRGDESCELTI